MKGRSKAYGSIADVTKLWPKGVVPYVITSSLRKWVISRQVCFIPITPIYN